MKTLSEINPWGMLIIFYGKDIENRSWYTLYRGPLLIHVSKKMHWAAREILRDLQKNKMIPLELEILDRARMQCGHIIGQVELVDCIQGSASPWAEQGMYHGCYGTP